LFRFDRRDRSSEIIPAVFESFDLTMKRYEWVLALTAFVVYASVITWGIPDRTPRERPDAWGTDEIAPGGLLEEIANTLYFKSGVYNPKYPLMGYIIQCSLAAPYYVAVAGADTKKTRELPYFWWIGLLARLTTVALAAALVVVACRTYAVLFGGDGAWTAGLLVLLLPPMFYYGRTTNVDLPELAIGSVALWQFAIILRDGLTRRTAILIGLFSALGIATKDALYGALVPAGLFVAVTEWRRSRRLVLLSAIVAAATYAVASGLLFNLDRYMQHLTFIRYGSTRHGAFYYGTHDPIWRVSVNAMEQLRQAMSLPLLLAAAAGCVLCIRYKPRALYFALAAPALLVFSIWPARFVVYRFVIPMAYVLAIFAAYALWKLPARRIALTAVVVWLTVQGADFSYQMRMDSRYIVRSFLEQNIRPGQTLGYYGTESNKLPFLNPAIQIVEGPKTFPALNGPDFLIVMPWQYFEIEHEDNLPEESYHKLIAGEAGYHLWFRWQTPALFQLAPGRGVNPVISVFSRQLMPSPKF